MRFRKGEHHPHPPRGPARHKYRMSDAALRQRCRNLRRTRLRSDRESLTIKLLIWQACFDSGQHSSQRTLARQLGVRRSYIWKVRKQATSEGLDARVQHGQRVTLDDLAEARRFTAKLREQEPGPLAPAPARRLYGGELRTGAEARGDQRRPMTAAANIAQTERECRERLREAHEWQRKHLPRYGGRRRIAFSVPVR